MNKTTFTQGPWHVQFLSESEKLPYMVFDDNIAAIARVHSEKDARLIAAAPELFEQCKFLEKVLTEAIMSGDSGADLELDQLRELLAKVGGEK